VTLRPDTDAATLDKVVSLVRERGAAAQLCAIRDGQLILDESFGCSPDDLFLIFSAGKAFIAVLVHMLAERGQLDLDAPVVRYWPMFGRNGKHAITIRQVLQHRAGVPVARSIMWDAVNATNWPRSIAALESARQAYPAGQVTAYHILSYGFILGEIVQRVTGTDVATVLRAELLDPLGLNNTFLGLPPELWHRSVPLDPYGVSGWIRHLLFDRRVVREAVIPAATISSTARDMARFYQMLLQGGELDGVRLLSPATITQARQPAGDGETDRLLGLTIRWSQGFQLGGPGPVPGRPRPMGRISSPDAFGHNGSNCCIGWADPGRRLVFAYTCNRLTNRLEGSPHQSDVSDAMLRSCPVLV
jgi:CubicO group peptidase (beta-lactamase class C family)